MTIPTDFPIQNLPYGVFRRRVEHGTATIGVAIGDRILDLRRSAAGGLFDGLPPETRHACACETLNPLMALTPRHWHALRARLTELLTDSARRRALPGPHAGCRDAAARRHRRLHRFLRLHLSRHQRRQPVPPGQSAAAQLQVRPHRLSRPRVLDRRQRRAGPPAPGPDHESRRRSPDLRPDTRAGLRTRSRASSSARAMRSASRSRSNPPRTTSSASACSTTGRRATYRPGNTSRSVRSSARASPRPSRRGWCRWRRWLPTARRVMRVRQATPRRYRISIPRRTARAAPSISRWRWKSPARRCATPTFRHSA